MIGSMRPTDAPPWWRLTGDSGTVPIGPAMTTLRWVVARLASLTRGAGIAYIAVQVAIWHSFYAAEPWRLAGPVAAAAWAAVVTAFLWRRWPAFRFCGDPSKGTSESSHIRKPTFAGVPLVLTFVKCLPR